MIYEKCGETRRKLLDARRDAAKGGNRGILTSLGSSIELVVRSGAQRRSERARSSGDSEHSQEIEEDLVHQALWYDAYGIEVGDEVTDPVRGSGFVSDIDVDDDGLVYLTFGDAEEFSVDLDEWKIIAAADGFSIARPAGFIPAVTKRLERDAAAATARGDFVELERLTIHLKMLTLPTAVKEGRKVLAVQARALEGGRGGTSHRTKRRSASLARTNKATNARTRADPGSVRAVSVRPLVSVLREALPRGWVELPGDGTPLYQNLHNTTETVWERPVLPAVPVGWASALDPATGAPYYVCVATSKTHWDHPEDQGV